MATKTPKTVYLCTQGDYSDYRVLAVFSSRYRAKKFVAYRYGPKGEPEWSSQQIRIEPFEVNIPYEGTGGWRCWNTRADGEPIWDPDLVPSGASVYWMDNGVPQVYGDGPTPEHARRSRDEMVRAIKAGTVVNPNAERVLERQRLREANSAIAADMALAIAAHPEEFADAPPHP